MRRAWFGAVIVTISLGVGLATRAATPGSPEPSAPAPQTPAPNQTQPTLSARPSAAAPSTQSEAFGREHVRQALDRYCAGCHSSRVVTAATSTGVAFDRLDLARIDADAEL